MLTFAQARALAEKWIELVSDNSAELVPERTVAKPYGWVFFWESSEAVKNPNRVEAQLVGNAPFLVLRDSLELRVLGTAQPLERYLEILERELPAATLARRAEQPTW